MMRSMFVCVLLVLACCGCQTLEQTVASRLEFVNHTPVKYAAKPADQPVDMFFEGAPSKEFEIIGEILGYVDHGADVRPWLAIRVRQVGGDGAMNIVTEAKTKEETQIVKVLSSDPRGHERETPVVKTRYYDVLKITAKVIRYK